MMTGQTFRNDCIILKTIDELVPKEHLVRKVDAAINLKFIEDEVEDLYSAFSKPSIPPLVLFKLLIINYMYGINSMRKTCEECEVNLAYRWYLGISIDDKIKIIRLGVKTILEDIEEQKYLKLYSKKYLNKPKNTKC